MAMPFNPSRLEDILPETAYRTGKQGKKLKAKRERLIFVLATRGRDRERCVELAKRLATCEPDSRCHSGACPECSRATQHFLAKAMRRFLPDKYHLLEEIVCVSVIPCDGRTAPDKIDSFVPALAVRRWRERLAKAGVANFIGGLDVSYNEHKEGKYKPHWSFHFWGFAFSDDLEGLKKNLKAVFPKEGAVRRPVKVEVWDGDSRALRYVFKTDFQRRIGTDKHVVHKSDGTSRTSRGTSDDRLRANDRESLLLFLDQNGLQSRLLLKSIQLTGSKSGDIKLILRPAKPGARRR